MKTTLAAMEFGTSKIVALTMEQGTNQKCDITGAGTAYYDGYMDGEWNAPELLDDAIISALTAAQGNSKNTVKEISIGVPAAFCTIRTVEVKVSMQGANACVDKKVLEEVFQKADSMLGNDLNGMVVHRSPAWFIIDDKKKTLQPIGVHGYEIRAMISYVIADSMFISDITQRLAKMGITVKGAYATTIAQAMLHIPEESRDRTAVLVDVGYLNTEVCCVIGDAAVYQTVLPIGGVHLAVELVNGLNITLDAAETIKRKYVYGLEDDSLIFEGTDENSVVHTFTLKDVAKCIQPCADELCSAIQDAIEESGVRLNQWSPIYLTGGGLTLNRGGREYLSTKLNRPVRDLPKKSNRLSNPAYSSALGLLDFVARNNNRSNHNGGVGSFLRNLFRG